MGLVRLPPGTHRGCKFKERTADTYASAVAQGLALLERYGHLDPQATPRPADICTTGNVARVANTWQLRAIDGEVRLDATTHHLMVERLIHIAEHLGELKKKDRKALAKFARRCGKPRRPGTGCRRRGFSGSSLSLRVPPQQRAVHFMPECSDPRFLLHLTLESDPTRGSDMKRSRFSEEQVIGILREQDAGAKTAEICRCHGISSATFYA